MKKVHSLHSLYQKYFLIVLALAIGTLGTILLAYEYHVGLDDIEKIEKEYLENKKNELRTSVEILISGIQYRQDRSHQQTKEILRTKMQEVLALATDVYLKKNIQEEPGHIKQHIIDMFMASKFADGKGYFWIMDTENTTIAHPYNKELVGKDLSQLEDRQGKKFIREFAQRALSQEQGGFVSYYWTDPDVSSQLQKEKGREKIAFVKFFKPYNWVIGVGLYVHDIEKTIQQDMISRVDYFRTGENGYVFNHTFEGVCLNHINKDLIGKNRWELTDKDGNKLIQDLSRLGRQPEGGFLKYIATINPATGKPSRKLSYVKSFDDWQWVLGTGVYLDEIEARISALRSIHKKRMQARIGIALILIVTAFTISLWGSTIIAKKLKDELQVFMEFFSMASKEQLKVDPQQLHVEEFRNLAVDLNSMIEAQQKTQEAVFKAKTTWERTFDAVPDTIMILDDQYRIMQTNRAMANMLQVPIETLIQKKCYTAFHGTDSPPHNCPHIKLLKDHRSHQSEIFDSKSQRYFATTVSPIKDSEGNFLGSVHISRDITEQKNAELERMATVEKLQKIEKMEAIGLMAGGVAHDLNNILSGVVSYPELLLLQLSKDDKLYGPIRSIHESGKRAAAVVADLLTVARGVATTREVCSLNSLIEEYLTSPEFKNVNSLHPKTTLQPDLATDLSSISCAPVHIQKVLMNLVTNAMEAIEGRGTVFVTTQNQFLEVGQVEALAPGEYVLMTIRDTGTGITETALKRIFEPFYSSKVMGRSGTGLGLSVVWNTIKDHDGGITVESDDSGTAFNIYLHSSEENEIQPESNFDINSIKGSGSILVVDDEQQQRDIATQMLSMLGYSVESVASGEEAVAFCRKKTVDILLLDMIMEPGINGFQTYQKIIALCPTQKAVITSGFSANNDVKEALALGVGGFITKPYSVKQLGETIQTVLQT